MTSVGSPGSKGTKRFVSIQPSAPNCALLSPRHCGYAEKCFSDCCRLRHYLVLFSSCEYIEETECGSSSRCYNNGVAGRRISVANDYNAVQKGEVCFKSINICLRKCSVHLCKAIILRVLHTVLVRSVKQVP